MAAGCLDHGIGDNLTARMSVRDLFRGVIWKESDGACHAANHALAKPTVLLCNCMIHQERERVECRQRECVTCLPALPPSPLPRPGPTSTLYLRVTWAGSATSRIRTPTPPTGFPVVCRARPGVWLGSRSCCAGARLTPRLTPSVDRRTRLAAPTSTRTRTRARAARHSSSLQRIVSGCTGRVLPARCSLYPLHSLE